MKPCFRANLKTSQIGYEVKSDAESYSQLSYIGRIFKSDNIMPFTQDIK